MTEPKRETWREFVEWAAGRLTSLAARSRMRLVAPMVQSKEAAMVAVLASGCVATGGEQALLAEWTAVLRSCGIFPPADPPSVAEVLESVATDLENASGIALKSHVNDYSRGYERGESNGYAEAARVLRAKVEEVT